MKRPALIVKQWTARFYFGGQAIPLSTDFVPKKIGLFVTKVLALVNYNHFPPSSPPSSWPKFDLSSTMIDRITLFRYVGYFAAMRGDFSVVATQGALFWNRFM